MMLIAEARPCKNIEVRECSHRTPKRCGYPTDKAVVDSLEFQGLGYTSGRLKNLFHWQERIAS